jgi:hypothetical protein
LFPAQGLRRFGLNSRRRRPNIGAIPVRSTVMAETLDSKPSTAYWITGGLLAVWNLAGLYQYFLHSTSTAEQLEDAGYSLQQVDFFLNTPAWAHSGYAIAVNAGVLGVLFLLLRKSWAIPLFYISLAGALVQDLDAFVIRNAIEVSGMGAVALPLIIIAVCAFEIFYARKARAKGWLS